MNDEEKKVFIKIWTRRVRDDHGQIQDPVYQVGKLKKPSF
jgi:hypothetical protein